MSLRWSTRTRPQFGGSCLKICNVAIIFVELCGRVHSVTHSEGRNPKVSEEFLPVGEVQPEQVDTVTPQSPSKSLLRRATQPSDFAGIIEPAQSSAAMQHSFLQQRQDEQPELPDPTTNFYLTPGHSASHQQTYMAFYDYGCCRTSESEYRGSSMGAMAPHDCMQSCLLSDFCIAAEIGGHGASTVLSAPDGANAFECTMYSGPGVGFHTGCTPASHCYRKVVPGVTKPSDLASTREQIRTTKQQVLASPRQQIRSPVSSTEETNGQYQQEIVGNLGGGIESEKNFFNYPVGSAPLSTQMDQREQQAANGIVKDMVSQSIPLNSPFGSVPSGVGPDQQHQIEREAHQPVTTPLSPQVNAKPVRLGKLAVEDSKRNSVAGLSNTRDNSPTKLGREALTSEMNHPEPAYLSVLPSGGIVTTVAQSAAFDTARHEHAQSITAETAPVPQPPETFSGKGENKGQGILAPQPEPGAHAAATSGNMEGVASEVHALARDVSTKQTYTQRSQWEQLEDQDKLQPSSNSPVAMSNAIQQGLPVSSTIGQVNSERSQSEELKSQSQYQQPSSSSAPQSKAPVSVTAPSPKQVSTERSQWEQLKSQDTSQQPSSVPSIVSTGTADGNMLKNTREHEPNQVANGLSAHSAQRDPSSPNPSESTLPALVTAPSPEQVSTQRPQWEQLKGQEALQQPSSIPSVVNDGTTNSEIPKNTPANQSDQVATRRSTHVANGDIAISHPTQTTLSATATAPSTEQVNGKLSRWQNLTDRDTLQQPSTSPPTVNNGSEKAGMLKDTLTLSSKPGQVANELSPIDANLQPAFSNTTQSMVSASITMPPAEPINSQRSPEETARYKETLQQPTSGQSIVKERNGESQLRNSTLTNHSDQMAKKTLNLSSGTDFTPPLAKATQKLPVSETVPSTETAAQNPAIPIKPPGIQSDQSIISTANSDLDSRLANATMSKFSETKETSPERVPTSFTKTVRDQSLGGQAQSTREKHPNDASPLMIGDANANQSTGMAKEITKHDFAANTVFKIDSDHNKETSQVPLRVTDMEQSKETSDMLSKVEHAKLTSAVGQNADQTVHTSSGNADENAYQREVTPKTLVSARSESAGSAGISQDDSARMAKQLSSVDSSAAEHLSSKASMPASVVRESGHSNNGVGSNQDASTRMAKQLSSLDSNVVEDLPSKASMPASNVHEASQSNSLKAARDDAAIGRQQVDLHLTEDEEHELQEKIDSESEEMNFPTGSSQSAGQQFNFFSTSSMPINSDAQVAVQEFVIENIDYDRLLNKATILDQIKTKVRDLVADAAGDGVGPEHVGINISKGSIRIRAEVTPPSDISLSSIIAALSTSISLKDDVVQQIKAVPNIADVATGWISCSSVGTAAATTTVFQMLPGYVKETVDAPTDTPTPAPGSVPGISKGEQSSIEDGSEEVRDAIEHDQSAEANATETEDEGWKLFGREMEWGIVVPILLVCCCVCIFGIGSVVMMAPPNSRALDHADQLQKHIEATANELPPQPYDNPSSSMMLPQSLQISGSGDADAVYDFTPDVLEGGWPVWKSKDRNLFIVTGRTEEWEIIECYGSQPNLDDDTIILRTFEPHGPRMPNNMPAWRRREGEEWIHDPSISMDVLGEFIPYIFGVGPTGPIPNRPS